MPKLSQAWKKWLAGGVISAVLIFVIAQRNEPLPGSVSDFTKNTERDGTGKVIKTVEIEQSDKTWWDLLSVLGVPLSLAGLGFYFQQQQQTRVDKQAKLDRERAEQQTKLEREIAESNQQEEILQTYFDRVSALLVDKNLLAIAAKDGTSEGSWASASIEEKELLDASVDVIRARTLSILRRLNGSRERKGRVIQFLAEADILSRLKMPLIGADLTNAELAGMSLNSANLRGVNFTGAELASTSLDNANLWNAQLRYVDLTLASLVDANLSSANFSFANLEWADLTNASLTHATFAKARLIGTYLWDVDLSHASFYEADLNEAKFSGANLSNADLSSAKNLTENQLSEAKLCNTQLPEGCNLDPNRDCEELQKLKQN